MADAARVPEPDGLVAGRGVVDAADVRAAAQRFGDADDVVFGGK
ncbi:hypothetical protein ABZ725_50695 [Streptomyces sp. NPDC006872]